MNIPYFRPSIGVEEQERVRAVLDSGWLTTGTAVQEFETKFAAYIGVPYAVALNSCTAGLHLSLDAAGVRAGDAVLTPTMTFGATAAVVRHLGARPILVDCDSTTLTMDPSALESAIENWRSDSTIKAVIPMHYGGQMADMNRILSISAKHGLAVIEDAAHALPASYKDSEGVWRGVGTTSPLASFSFYANKCITTGEGGMVTSKDPELAARVRTMSLHGLSQSAWTRFENKGSWSYEIIEPGYKYNLTDLAAAIGIAQLSKATALCERRSYIASVYSEQFAGYDELIETPQLRPDRKSSWHIYGIRLNLDRLAIDRAEFIKHLRARGITCSVHWMPLHLHPYYRKQYGYRESDFPVASREWPRMLSLPIFPSMTEAELDYICASVREVAENNRVRRIFPVVQEGIASHQNGVHGY
jgi:dTDP-4-amino-4,6-dideoxygalactose transaminase